jgi:hypothetical protein
MSRANFKGSEYILYDEGANPKKGKKEAERRELGIVLYGENALRARGPRRIMVVVPESKDNQW